jgi:putative DNA primase/helicase
MSDPIPDMIRAMEIEGVRPTEPIAQRLASGELIRFHCDGDGKGRQNGWAILYLDDLPAGAFGNYRLGISRKWRADRDNSLTPAEREAMQREWSAAKQRKAEERARSATEAARDAADMWANSRPASVSHGYVTKKALDPSRFRQSGSSLLVPMFDGSGRLWNIQRIAEDGAKRFLRGGRTDALFFVIGSFTKAGEICGIGEGVATMHRVHRALGCPCVVAFSAKNLAAVSRLWWSARPDLDFVIFGDDDDHLDRNIGEEAARAAAEEIGGRYVLPERSAA